jgi:hypothetical protein
MRKRTVALIDLQLCDVYFYHTSEAARAQPELYTCQNIFDVSHSRFLQLFVVNMCIIVLIHTYYLVSIIVGHCDLDKVVVIICGCNKIIFLTFGVWSRDVFFSQNVYYRRNRS